MVFLVLLIGIFVALCVLAWEIYQKPAPVAVIQQPVVIEAAEPEPEPESATFPVLSIEKWVRLRCGSWEKSVETKPGATIEFKIIVASLGRDPANNVYLRDILPNEIDYKSNLEVNGVFSNDSLKRISLGNLLPGQSAVITFKARLCSSKNQYDCGDNELVNAVQVFGDKANMKEDKVAINVYKYCYKPPCYYYWSPSPRNGRTPVCPPDIPGPDPGGGCPSGGPGGDPP